MERNRSVHAEKQQEVLARLGQADAPSSPPRPARTGILLYAGRIYPCTCSLAQHSPLHSPQPLIQWVDVLRWEAQVIPCAIGPQPTVGPVSFATAEEAEQYALREDETFALLWDCTLLTALSDLYPERTSWYCEEIVGMIGVLQGKTTVAPERLVLERVNQRATASVWVWPQHGEAAWLLVGEGASVDEAIEQLYAHCYQQVVAVTDAATDHENDEEVPSC